VSVVPQEPFLFAKTIRENITLARVPEDDDELYQICRDAAVHDVILGFEKGYDTLVGGAGCVRIRRSAAENCHCRALITHSPILIFDDSLSAVDTETDLAIRNALRARNQGATTILISHRITSLSRADLIIVLDHGRIVQSGTHNELVSEPGMYQRIWEIQSSLEAEVIAN